MERTLEKQAIPWRISVHKELLFGLPAFLVAFIPSPWTIGFVLPYLAYVYMCSSRGWISVLVGVCLGTLMTDIVYGYLFLLLFSGFCLCVQIVKFMEQNIYKSLWVINAILCIAFLIIVKPTWEQGITVLGFTILYTYLVQNRYHWTKSNYTYSRSIYVLLGYSALILLVSQVPKGYQLSAGLIGLALFMLIGDHEEVSLILLFQVIIQPFDIGYSWLILLACLNIFKGQQLIQCGIVLLGAGFLATSPSLFSQICLLLILVLIYQDKFIPFLEVEMVMKKVSQDLTEREMNQKLHNFSAIFETLSSFYANASDVQSEMLQNMSQALAYTASQMRVNTTFDERRQKILNALEGYQYEIEEFVFEEMEDGNLHLEVTIKNIKRSEIKTTLMPLIEVLTKSKMILVVDHSRKFHKAYHHIVLDSATPYYIDAYADSVKNVTDQSGDCFSVYRYRQNVICMISDGMGHGPKAAETAHVITDIFQRMMASGIAQDQAIRCMNRLLQSDTYATLDVITFDRMRGVAYISKAAACPTYLIRNQELHEISSSSLPVGIIAASEADYYVVELLENDLFLMASDGVYMNEITNWMRLRNDMQSIRKQTDIFKEILQKQPRMDDSTILLARVGKQSF